MTEVRAILLQELKVSLSAMIRVQIFFSTYPNASLMYMTYCNTCIGKSKIISIVNQNSYDQCLPYDNRRYLQLSTYLTITYYYNYTIYHKCFHLLVYGTRHESHDKKVCSLTQDRELDMRPR